MIHRYQPPGPPARVVVLGSSGFVGREVVAHLSSLDVTTLPLTSSDLDLRRPEATNQLRAIIHQDDILVITSAITPDRGRDAGVLVQNVTMGAHLAAALEQSPCAQVIYVSSDAVYADDAHPVREGSCSAPASFHGLMHLARERMLRVALGRPGTPLLILRPSLLYGANDTHNGYGPNRFLRSALVEARIRLFGGGEEKRDHVYVRDLSRLMALWVTRRSAGVLNVATGTAVAFLDVARSVADLVGDHVKIECLPRATPIVHRHFDVGRLIRGFPGFQFTPLRAGLAESLRELAAAAPSGTRL